MQVVDGRLKSGCTWAELIEVAILIEKSAKSFYEEAADSLEAGSVCGLLREFAGTKKRHVELLSSLEVREDEERAAGVVFNEGLLKYVAKGSELAAEFGSNLMIVEFSVNFEEEALRFFTSLRDHGDLAIRSIVGQVVDENRLHTEKMRVLMLTTLGGMGTPRGM